MRIDVFTRPKHARSIDYIDMLLYVGPTLLLESFIISDKCSNDAAQAFISLITACSLALQWEIDNDDIIAIEE